MSNNAAPEPPGHESPARPHRRRQVTALAVLVALGAAGGLVWLTADGSPDGERPAAESSPGAGRDGQPVEKAGPLAGKTVVIDPGHNPNNRDHPDEINRTVDIGTEKKECDNTGTDTVSGYAEAEFTLDLARRVRKALQQQGAQVRLTHDGKRPYGPCLDGRAEAGNRARADAAVSLHADGAPQGARGFHAIVPEPIKERGADTRAIVAPSRLLGEQVVHAFGKATGTSPADYVRDGKGIDARDDLGGLNLSTVPKIFLECGNMRDPKDARLLTDAGWRDRAAQGVAKGISTFLHGKADPGQTGE